MAARGVHQFTGLPYQSVGLEADEQIAKAFVKSHHACYVKSSKRMSPHTLFNFQGN